jgi:biopolymer transport protein ExbB/TolQ
METGIIFAFSIAAGSLGVAIIALSMASKLEKRVKELEKK